eukprot:7290462-Pyramimonas_sp.AAC.1
MGGTRDFARPQRHQEILTTGLKRRSQKFDLPTGPQERLPGNTPRPSGRQEEIPIFDALFFCVLVDPEPDKSGMLSRFVARPKVSTDCASR